MQEPHAKDGSEARRQSGLFAATQESPVTQIYCWPQMVRPFPVPRLFG
jgi:hypothetical protein